MSDEKQRPIADQSTETQWPLVSIILVCYNGIADTIECLESLAQLTYPNYNIVLVDNASVDGTAKTVRERFPEVTVLEAGENLGFAGGNNVGIQYAVEKLEADYCFLLNNDTTVEPGLLEPLVTYSEDQPTAGVIGPLMCYYDAPDTIWSAGGRMNARAESILVDEGRPVAEASFSDATEQDFIVGCGMLVRRSVWDAIGLFDDRYFLYYEESDLCFRARRAGLRCLTVPKTRLWHKVSRSTGATSELTLYYMRRNALLFLEKNGTMPGIIATLIDDLRLFSVWKVKSQTRRADVLGWAIQDYFLRHFGRAKRLFR